MNPYAQRLAKAQERYEQALRRSRAYSDNAMPGTYVTGNSGVPAARLRRLDRQIDRTIDLAKKANWHKRNVDKWQAKYDGWEWRRENPSPHAPVKKPRPLSDRQRMSREIGRLLFDLDCDGPVSVNGHVVRYLVGWSDEIQAPLGIIEVKTPDGAIFWRRAKSIQGVHFEETALAVVGALLEKGKETDV